MRSDFVRVGGECRLRNGTDIVIGTGCCGRRRVLESGMERVNGIEPSSSAWEAEVIPLYDTRLIRRFYLMWSDGSLVVVEFHLVIPPVVTVMG